MPDEPLTPRQVAERLGVTPRTVQRWITSGRLPAVRVGGRMRVPAEAIGAVIEAPPPAMGEPRDGLRAGDGGGATRGPVRPIRTLLIANRGEIATRVARTAHRLGMRVIGVHAPGDPAAEGIDQALPVASYLDPGAILAVARATGADAIHPGYGFLSENAAFAAAVEAGGLRWVGPPPSAIAAMGDKSAARRRVAALGVPVLAGYDGAAQDDATLRREARRIGWPILVKPSAGGGGKGMRVVRGPAELGEALGSARREALRAFGDDRLILERFLSGPRHIEVQVLFDAHGSGVHLGERDCSAQRRNQKIVEEAPGPSVTSELRADLGAAALSAAAGIGYVGAGTVEFLVADDGSFAFLEMNTRLQVEHPVTEAVTGHDLVEEQLRVAEGLPLAFGQASVSITGHAIEARLYAEDPEEGFLPATGRVELLRWPEGRGVRVDAGVRAGDVVSDRYDPMLAKVIVHGSTRDGARRGLVEALRATRILGVRTNLRFLRWLLETPEAIAGQIRTDSIAGMAVPHAPGPGDAAWEAAARLLLEEKMPTAGDGRPTGSASDPWGGGWRMNAAPALRLRSGAEERSVDVSRGGPLMTAPRGGPAAVAASGVAFVDVDGRSTEFIVAPPPTVEDAVRHAASQEGLAALVAPMPGRVIAVRASVGQAVDARQAIVVIEAMKMEHAVTTPIAGTVTGLFVSKGRQVQRGDLLAEVSA
jgi:3-methylcrotonyl-CoA carboxylase alpha subunit